MTHPFTKAAELASAPERLGFEEARDLYQSVVFAFVARRVRPIEDAEDIVAAVFADAFSQWRKIKGDPRLWLFGIARRKMAGRLRRQKRNWPLREADACSDGMSAFVSAAEAEAAARVLSKLPMEEREVLLMSVADELTIAEIAVVIGRTEKAANSLLGRARARARRLTEKTGDFR